MKQRREKVLQNAKDRKFAKGNPLVALQSSLRTNSAPNDTQSITNTNDEVIDDANTDAIIGTENTDNAAINAENTDNAAIDADNTDNAAAGGKNSDDAAMSDKITKTTLQQVMVIWIILQQVRLVLYIYLCLHDMVEKPKIQAKLKPPQNVHLLLQNLQQVTPFLMITLL